jgi:uncharacterized protein YecE (DUF72 family)
MAGAGDSARGHRGRVSAGTVRIGTAGWSIPKRCAGSFPCEGSHLERYAQVFTAVEINSSFYRSHKPGTYARWAGATPVHFRFSVKLPREITHKRKLVGAIEPLEQFLEEVGQLGEKLGPILVQLPPSFAYDAQVAQAFFIALRERHSGDLVCEPRHSTWFTGTADALLSQLRIARVAADPPPASGAAEPGGWPELIYRRLHGSPRVYYSAYAEDALNAITAAMRQEDAHESWCIFDNTAHGAAWEDALNLQHQL